MINRHIKLLIYYFIALCIFFWVFYDTFLTSQELTNMNVVQKITLFGKVVLGIAIFQIIDLISKQFQVISRLKKSILFIVACLSSAMIMGYIVLE